MITRVILVHYLTLHYFTYDLNTVYLHYFTYDKIPCIIYNAL